MRLKTSSPLAIFRCPSFGWVFLITLGATFRVFSSLALCPVIMRNVCNSPVRVFCPVHSSLDR